MQSKPYKRINVILPEQTIDMLDRIAGKENRSQFIETAVHFYADQNGKGNLLKLLKEGAIAHAQRDLALSEEWFDLEEEACQAKDM